MKMNLRVELYMADEIPREHLDATVVYCRKVSCRFVYYFYMVIFDDLPKVNQGYTGFSHADENSILSMNNRSIHKNRLKNC